MVDPKQGEDDSPETRTARLIGPRVRVHCHHHQAVARLAAGLTVTGRADDGTVEAVEAPGPGFVLGVQWHPEENGEDGRLFAALTAAAARRAAGQPPGERLAGSAPREPSERREEGGS